MKQTVINLVERLLEGSELTRDEVLWGALFIGLIFASLHLVTMLVTRWGDHKATTKSLIFSVLVHTSCAIGLVAVNPPLLPAKPEEEINKPILLQQVFVEGEEEIKSEQKGNTPIWERPPKPVETKLTRTERVPIDLKPPESLDRHMETLTPPEVDIPKLTSLPDEPVATPKPEHQAERGPLKEAVAPLKIEDRTAEARPEVELASPSNVRSRVARPGQIETSVTRNTRRGSVDRVEEELDLSKHLAAIDAQVDPTALLKQAKEEISPQRRSGPAPSSLIDPEAGTNAKRPNAGSQSGSPVPPRTSRRRTRTPRSRDEGTLEPFRRTQTARIPRPTSDLRVAARDTVPLDLSRTGPKPNVLRPQFQTDRTARNVSVPSTYLLRSLERRKESARKFGGTDASERAVELSLRWLALHQSSEGFWDSDAYGGGNVQADADGKDQRGVLIEDGVPGRHADSGVTALAILAFLGAGYTHEEGQYAEVVDRALRWLIRNQRKDGFLGGKATYYASMYCHAMATYALAEAYGMQSDPSIDTGLRLPLSKAVDYILDHQNPDGGWRYRKGQKSDMSMFGWQLMALKSADITGIRIPQEVKDRLRQFLRDRSIGPHSGLATYRVTDAPRPPTSSMTAEALFCKQMLGIERADPASTEAVEFLMQRLPRRSQTNLYYWYYGTLAMYQYGGDSWRQWNESVRDELVASQETTGDMAGSWDARGPWGAYGGRVYATALSTLCLEVYYRFLPLYNMGGRYEDL